MELLFSLFLFLRLSVFNLCLTAYSLVMLIVGFHHWHISSPAALSALSSEIHAWAVVSVCMCVCLYLSSCRDVPLKLSSGLHCVWPILTSNCVPCILFLFHALERSLGVWVCEVGGWWWGVSEQVVHLRVWRCTSAVIWEWDSGCLQYIIVHSLSFSSSTRWSE